MKVTQYLAGLLLLAALLLPEMASANIDPASRARRENSPTGQNTQINFRSNCDNAVRQFEQEINNVRARLTTGGDVWWDGTDGLYIVPKPPPGVDAVSSIFAGSVWLGGLDPGGNPKVAAQRYGRPNSFDYYPGPLTPEGTTSRDTCARWDKFFVVNGEDIRQFRALYATALAEDNLPLDPEDIPESILGWPSTGNPYFSSIHGFDLPNDLQGLAGFWNEDDDPFTYDPTQGDFPVIEIRGCSAEPQFPEQMVFWIYNDAGNVHRESNLEVQIQMEIQVQAFAYTTSDDINSMTFQRYKLINRAQEDLLETYFAMWVDPDLGCYTDDFVGCDTTRSMAYVYNTDELDGTNGCTCDQGVPTYCDAVPLLGVDYFRGPRDEFGNELGMSSFIYMNNSAPGNPPDATQDPNTATQYYDILRGIWLDGSCLQEGGDGYDEGTPCTRYAFPGAPNDENSWSMAQEGLGIGDRRTLQASGPFTLVPGAVNELIIGVVWVPDQSHPNPSITRLQTADDLAQDLFDNCFDILDGPDAPDVDWVELDREIVAVLSNDLASNNFNEEYAEDGLGIPPGEDPTYRFEGYRVFQLANPSVSISSDRDDLDKVRLVAEFDVNNGITNVYNWTAIGDEDTPINITEPILAPSLITSGTDDGIQHTLSIKTDAFASGDETRLINHRRYYFTVVAYAYNNYKDYDPTDTENPGQVRQYLESNRNIGDPATGSDFYEVIPRPILDRELMASYGDGAAITRLAGFGNNSNYLELNDETKDAIEAAFAGGAVQLSELTYVEGAGPIKVQVVNPRTVVNGDFELTMVDSDLGDDDLDADATWQLSCIDDCGVATILSDRPISEINEQVIPEFGFSVTIGNAEEPGVNPMGNNGAIGGAITYEDPDGDRWLSFLPDGFQINTGVAFFDNSISNYVNTDFGEEFYEDDIAGSLTDMFPGIYPYQLMDWTERENGAPYISPVWLSPTNTNASANRQLDLEDLINVDIVFTSDKSLWTKCPIIETANIYYDDSGFEAEGGNRMFDTRARPSVTREADPANPNVAALEVDPDPRRDEGMGWFPGYAVDVETGRRLQVFFGENSVYDGVELTNGFLPQSNGADMIFNPSSVLYDPIPGAPVNMLNFVGGGQHFIYVTNLEYDEGEFLESRFESTSSPVPTRKINGAREIIWAGVPWLTPGTELLSYADGLIPNNVRVSLRVNNSYGVSEDTEVNNGYPTYQFSIEDAAPGTLDQVGIESALDEINVVPNPYYAFSDYEDTQFDTEVKITNLPAQCVVTIYSLDGKFIRQYDRDEQEIMLRGSDRPVGTRQINPDITWDLDNYRGIPVASGVYLIHVAAPGMGERTLKWFGVNRQFDPSGL